MSRMDKQKTGEPALHEQADKCESADQKANSEL